MTDGQLTIKAIPRLAQRTSLVKMVDTRTGYRVISTANQTKGQADVEQQFQLSTDR